MLTRKPATGKPNPVGQTPKVLLTGFDAFGGETVNPSWLAVQALHGKRVLGRKLVAVQLPTVFDASRVTLRKALGQFRPELVICIGQAGGRSALSLERIAINVTDARIADNAGIQPIDTPVVATGPAAYFTGLPIKALLLALQADGIAAEVSQTAGTFVCNQVFYGLMHLLATQRHFKHTRGGFIHVPFVPEQTQGRDTPSLPLDDIVRGIKVAVRAALLNTTDLALGAGAEQ
jgi:pyroglutamyl-peptidase